MNRFLSLLLLLAFSPMFLNAQVDETKPIRVTKAVAYAKSLPLSELAAKLSPDKAESIVEKEVKNELDYDKWPNEDANSKTGSIQTKNGTIQSRGPVAGFAGQGGTGFFPPDTDGDVSETHFIQVVNSKYNVYLKNGTKVLGPLNLSALWMSLPGPWVGTNNGDPIVLYDEEADRWVITQFALPNSTHNYELFAVSATNDPLGSYHLYAFEFGVQFNDYPKIGVWNDGYYATYNLFSNNTNPSFVGSKVTSVEREKMLVGDPDAAMIEFLKYNYYATMPADIDGADLPEAGEPCPIMYITGSKKIELWDFHSDWDNPNNSLLTLGVSLTPTNFSKFNGDVPQPNGQGLDGLGNMIMNRLAYRKFDAHESMVVNHTVSVSGKASIRWYEFRKTTASWTLHQEGTYAPNDGVYRWMGSTAMNSNGDIAIAYSAANSSDVHPSIRYTGRRANDPLGEMTITEVELKTGTTSQNGFSRWGDYSCLNVDPVDDSTFWFTTEYNGWKTWISSFDLGEVAGPSCNAGEDGAVCPNDQFTTTGYGNGVLEIEWTSDGDGWFSPNDSFLATYIRGSQDVINGGCTLTLTVTGFDGVSTYSDDMYLSIVPLVNAGEDVSIVNTAAFTCDGSTNAPDGTITWTTSGDGTFSDASMLTPIYTPGTADIDTQEVTLTMENTITDPCDETVDDDMVLTILPIGINEITTGNRLDIYPNPTNDIFTLNIGDLTVGEDFTFFVYTSYGKEVYRQLENAKSSKYEKVIDMADFRAGIYFVSVTSEKGTSTTKVVKK